MDNSTVKAPITQRVFRPPEPPRPRQGGGRPHSWFTAWYTRGNIPQSTAQRYWSKYLEFAGLYGLHSPDQCPEHHDTFIDWIIASADIEIHKTKHRQTMKALRKAGASNRSKAKATANSEAQLRILTGELERVRDGAKAVVQAAHDAWSRAVKYARSQREAAQ